jgi:hypothetical protein
MPAGRNHHVLLAGPLEMIGHRRRLPARGQRALPQLLAGVDVERAQKVVRGGGDEDQAARGDNRPAMFGMPNLSTIGV